MISMLKKIKKRLIKQAPSKLDILLRMPKYTQGKIDIDGAEIVYPDAISFAWTYREIFEKKVYYFKSETNSPVIIDCGANIGLSLIYFKKLYPDSKIIAFEPDPLIFNCLEKNTLNLISGGVTLLQKGLWDDNKTISFSTEGSDAGRISEVTKTDSFHKREIQCVRLSDYIHEDVDFLKIDVEGSELQILLDLSKSLKIEKVKRMFIEYHSFINSAQMLSVILQLLEKHKFRYYLSEGAIVTKNPFLEIRDYLGMDMQLNIYAFKE